MSLLTNVIGALTEGKYSRTALHGSGGNSHQNIREDTYGSVAHAHNTRVLIVNAGELTMQAMQTGNSLLQANRGGCHSFQIHIWHW